MWAAIDGDAMQKQFQKMKITAEEKEGRVRVDEDDLDKVGTNTQIMVACKILTTKTIITQFFKTTMPKIWGLKDNVKIEKAGKKYFHLQVQTQKREEKSGGRGTMDLR